MTKTTTGELMIFAISLKKKTYKISSIFSDPIDKPKGRRKHDKFNGMSEEEVIQRFLPDQLTFNLDVVIVSL